MTHLVTLIEETSLSSQINSVLELAGDVQLEVLASGDEFLGFGAITIEGVPVRSAQVPLRVHLTTPLGISYSRFTTDVIEGDQWEHRIYLTAHGTRGLRSEICDDYEEDLFFPSAAPTSVTDQLVWILKPCRLEIDGQEFNGFSYAIEFNSESRKIYRLTVESTWELGGSIEGVTHLHQGQCSPPVYEGNRDSYFSTSIVKTLAHPIEGEAGLANHSMQTNSRHGTLQSFDYQYSPHGVLIGLWERGEYVRSLIQKNTGEDVLFVIDEHHLPYGLAARTAAKQILFAPVTSSLQAHDLWKMTKDHVQRGFQQQWGFRGMALRTEEIICESWMGNQPGSDCWFNGRIVSPTDFLKVLADEWMPAIAGRGIELVGFGAFNQCDFTEMGTRSKREDGIHGDLFVSSVCNVWRYQPASYWGGMQAYKYYADRAHELGLKVGTWIGCHISRNAPILREHPEWFSIGRTGKPNMAGYSSALGAPANFNTGFRRWLVDDLKRWRDEAGLDYIFIDSWGNLGMLPIHFNADFSNNLDGLGRLIADLQEAGFEYIVNEGMGPFCPPRFGLNTHQTQAEGQNSLHWWIGNEGMADGANPIINGFVGMDEAQAHACQFRFFANNCLTNYHLHEDEMPAELLAKLGSKPGGAHPRPKYYADLMALWPQVRDSMYGHRRETLPDERGVLWSGDARDVLWSYKPFSFHENSGRAVHQIYPARKELGTGPFTTEPLAVYLIGK